MNRFTWLTAALILAGLIIFLSIGLESNRIFFTDDMESAKEGNNQRTHTIFHSAHHSTFVSPDSPTGRSFIARYKELGNHPFRKIRISFYVYEMDPESVSSMVFEVRSAKDETLYYETMKTYEMIRPLRWSLISREFDLKGLNDPDFEFRIYPLCQGTSEAFFDDYLIEFYY